MVSLGPRCGHRQKLAFRHARIGVRVRVLVDSRPVAVICFIFRTNVRVTSLARREWDIKTEGAQATTKSILYVYKDLVVLRANTYI